MKQKSITTRAVCLLSILAVAITVICKISTSENVSALVNCVTVEGDVLVFCTGKSGVCIFHDDGADHVCLGAASVEKPEVPIL